MTRQKQQEHRQGKKRSEGGQEYGGEGGGGQEEEDDEKDEEDVGSSCKVVKGGRRRAPSRSLRVVFDVWLQNGIFDELLKCRRRFKFCDSHFHLCMSIFCEAASFSELLAIFCHCATVKKHLKMAIKQ